MMVRLLGEADDLGRARLAQSQPSGRSAAGRSSFAALIRKRKRLYRDLLKVTRATLDYVDAAMARLTAARLADIKVEAWLAAVRQYRRPDRADHRADRAPGARWRAGAGRRQAGQPVRAAYRHHVKGSREVQYGHKLNLSTGKTGMILDLVIEDGNAAVDRFQPMLDRHIEHYGKAPRQAPPTAAMPAPPTWPRPRPWASGTWPSTRTRAGHRGHGEEPLVYRKLRN